MAETIAPENMMFDEMVSDTPTPQLTNDSTHAPQSVAGADFDSLQDDEDKYDTMGQTLKAGAEGAAKGFLGSTLSHAAETKLLGVDPQEIVNREEAHPIAEGLGQGVGFGVGFGTGLGPEAMLMGQVGKAAAGLTAAGKLTGAALEAAPLLSKVGSSALQQATEMAVMAGDDELAKKIWTNPNETADQAIANIGLSAALGGAGGAFVTGAISPLWKATVGPGVESFLSGLSSKLGGHAAEEGINSTAKSLGDAAGIDLSAAPSVAAKINGDPMAERFYSGLSQSDTIHFGRKVQEEIAHVTNEAGNKIAETLGHSNEYVDNLASKLDKYTTGREVADTLHSEIERVAKPIGEAYDVVNDQFKASPVSKYNKMNASESIARKALDNGWLKAADDSQKRLMDKVLDKLPAQETAEDLKKFITNLRENHPFGSPTYQTAKEIADVLKTSQERAVMEGIAARGGSPEAGKAALEHYQGLKTRYSELMNTMDNLNEHLHIGKYYGPQSFLNNLKEFGTTKAEDVLNRLSGSKKADALNILQQFPETLSKVRQFHLDEALNSGKNAEGALDPRKFSRNFDKLSPQIKDLIADPVQQQRLKSIGELMTKMNDSTHNFSNTARTLDKLTHGLISPMSLLAGLTGHGDAGLLTHFGGLGLKEGEGALKYAMLKFLASDAPISGPGFKSMVQMIDNTVKGEQNLTKAVGSVFKGGSTYAITMPSATQLAKLDKIVSKQETDPNHLQDKILNSQTGHYMAQHQMALTDTSMKAIAYLHSIKPQETKLGPLDQPIPPSKAAEARYTRALEIAENPNVVIQHIKEGTLLPSDVKDLTSLYPSLYPAMQKKIMEQVVDKHHDAEHIPYSTRMSLSLFMGQPLDSTMTPQSIMAAQPKPQQPPPQQSKPGTQKAGSAINKASSSYKTPGQAAESDRSNRD